MQSLAAQAERSEDKAHDSYRPSVTPAELAAIVAGKVTDARRVSPGRLLMDIHPAVRRWTRGYSRDARHDIAQEALLYVAQRQAQRDAENSAKSAGLRAAHGKPNRGAKVLAYIAAAEAAAPAPTWGAMPLRREWLDHDHGATFERQTVKLLADGHSKARPVEIVTPTLPSGMLSEYARRELAIAVREGARRLNEHARELPTETDALGAAIESGASIAAAAERIENDAADVLEVPDVSAEELAQYAGLTLAAARSLTRAMLSLDLDQCADAWGTTRDSAKSIDSRGKRELHKRYPDDPEGLGALHDALRAAVPAIREARADAAMEAVAYARDWPDASDEALQAVAMWASVVAPMAPERRALVLASRKALLRHGKAPELADTLACSIPRQLVAERRREYRRLATGTPTTAAGKS